MATESAKQPPPASSPSWYSKLFEHWRNRNRIGPARVELPDCDFFIVGTRRTLRVLRPTLKSEWYYESTNNDRPESINDNFFTRWSRRPHSSNHCRCSFRQSSRLSTTEEEIISAELNRIRTSLCEAEKSEQGIEELEQRVSANLQKLQSAVPVAANSDEEALEVASNIVLSTNSCDERADEQKIKNKIVKDLERYINVLLEEILDDTVKLVARADVVADDDDHGGGALAKKDKANSKKKLHFNDSRCEGKSPANEAFLKDLSFSFHAEDSTAKLVDEIERKHESSSNEGYVNHAFIGSTNDPDSLDFYVAPPSAVGTEVPLDPLDCTDSGINSVETVEFQPDQEPSLEQSLLRIIDEKFGRTTSTSNLEDVTANGENNEIENNLCDAPIRDKVSEKAQETIESIVCDEFKVKDVEKKDSNNSCVEVREVPSTKDVDDSSADEKELEEIDEELKFDKAKLELRNSGSESSLKTKKKTNLVTKLREKISTNVREPKDNNNLQESCKKVLQTSEAKKNATPIEMQDYRRKWPHVEDSSKVSDCDQNPRDFVVFRRNMKPTIVFLHGFGSSAEIFEPQLQYFSARGYPCIAPDILGHGMSSAPDRSKDYLFGKLLRDLEAVLHYYAFKPGQKCVLVAHNYGCSFATALACKYDSNIHQLVLISGGGPIPLAPPAKEGACQCFLRAILSPFIMCGLHRDILYSARGRQHPYCGPEPVEQWPSHMKYVLDGMVWPEGDYVFHRRICTPTLLVHGLRDNKVSLVQECQMERTMMKAYLEAIPTAGHTPMTDCPEQLNHMIHCFIDLWKNKNW